MTSSCAQASAWCLAGAAVANTVTVVCATGERLVLTTATVPWKRPLLTIVEWSHTFAVTGAASGTNPATIRLSAKTDVRRRRITFYFLM